MKLVKNQKGQGLTEYIVLLMLVAVTSIGVVATLGKSIKTRVEAARKAIDKVSPSGYSGGGGSDGDGLSEAAKGALSSAVSNEI